MPESSRAGRSEGQKSSKGLSTGTVTRSGVAAVLLREPDGLRTAAHVAVDEPDTKLLVSVEAGLYKPS